MRLKIAYSILSAMLVVATVDALAYSQEDMFAFTGVEEKSRNNVRDYLKDVAETCNAGAFDPLNPNPEICRLWRELGRWHFDEKIFPELSGSDKYIELRPTWALGDEEMIKAYRVYPNREGAVICRQKYQPGHWGNKNTEKNPDWRSNSTQDDDAVCFLLRIEVKYHSRDVDEDYTMLKKLVSNHNHDHNAPWPRQLEEDEGWDRLLKLDIKRRRIGVRFEHFNFAGTALHSSPKDRHSQKAYFVFDSPIVTKMCVEALLDTNENYFDWYDKSNYYRGTGWVDFTEIANELTKDLTEIYSAQWVAENGTNFSLKDICTHSDFIGKTL